MGSRLKQQLKSLCSNNGWSYAVLWSFNQTNPMFLTTKEAYCEDKMGPLIDNMLLKFHVLGEGTIGQVALHGKHQWVSLNSHGEDGERSMSNEDQSVAQDRCEIQSQCLFGIKTIAVVPMESQGVLEFGSTQKILERLGFIDQAKKLFCEEPLEKGIKFQCAFVQSETDEGSITSTQQDWSLLCSQFQPFPTEAEALLYTKADSILDYELQNGFPFTSPLQHLDGCSPCLSSWSSEASALRSAGFQSLSENGKWDSKDVLWHDGLDQDSVLGLQGMTMELEPVEFLLDYCNSYTPDDLSQWLSPSLPCNRNQPETTTSNNLSGAAGVTSASTAMFGGEAQSHGSANNLGNSLQTSNPCTFTFDRDKTSEVVDVSENIQFKEVGVDFDILKLGKYLEGINQPVISNCSRTAHGEISECITELNAEAMNGSKRGFITKQGHKDITDSCSTYSSVTDVEHEFSAAKRRKVESSPFYSHEVSNMNLSCLDGSLNCGKNSHSSVKTEELPPKSQLGFWINDSYSISIPKAAAIASIRPESPVKSKKKRARHGESTRPRPKDRQMIQDRLKELRELIPRGAKCPIDALLDRTIKYTLFLKSARKHADMLKHADKPKMICKETGVILKDNVLSGGATWALEVGDELSMCPIIVQDLNPPGKMLIELVCEDQGYFLEIADIIRRLGLSIFRGVMESQETKIWARFIVEASAGVTRQEVFCYLLSVLQEPGARGMDSVHVEQPQDMKCSSANNCQQLLLPSPGGLTEILQ